MDYLLPPSSLTLLPNRIWRPAKMPRCARPITTLLLGSISFIDSITPLGSSLLPTARATFLYISRALNDISLLIRWLVRALFNDEVFTRRLGEVEVRRAECEIWGCV
jgi:hypothetical protein